MAKMATPKIEEDGWTVWVQPQMKNYHMGCCDCGLVHDIDFRIADTDGSPIQCNLKVQMRVRRNNRSTANLRHHMKKEKK